MNQFMKDERIEKRMDGFQSRQPSLLESRLDFSLSLRKQFLTNRIMEKRLNHRQNKLEKRKPIDISTLQLAAFKDKIEEYENLVSPLLKVEFLFNALQNEIVELDIFSELDNFYGNNCQHETNDYVQFCIQKLLNFLDEDQQINEDESIFIPRKLFKNIMSELYSTSQENVKFALSDVLVNLTCESKNMTQYFIEDIKYLGVLFKLTFLNNYEIVKNVIISVANIFIDCPKSTELTIQYYPFHLRIKELLGNDSVPNIFSDYRIECLNSLAIILEGIENKNCFNSFTELVDMALSMFMKNYTSNEGVLVKTLEVINELSMNDQLCERMLANGIAFEINQVIIRKDLQPSLLKTLLLTLGNFFCINSIVSYFLNLKILDTFQRLLNTYMNTINKKEKKILKDLLFAINNIALGPEEHIHAIINTNLLKTMLQLIKIQVDNEIYFGVCEIFSSILEKGDDNSIIEIIKLNAMKLFCKGLEMTFNSDCLILCLKSMIKLIKNNLRIYSTFQNLKNDYYSYCAKKNVDILMDNKNKEISDLATEIKDLIDKDDEIIIE